MTNSTKPWRTCDICGRETRNARACRDCLAHEKEVADSLIREEVYTDKDRRALSGIFGLIDVDRETAIEADVTKVMREEIEDY